MKTLRIESPCVPWILQVALVSAGVKVATVRSAWANPKDQVCLWAVIVFSKGYDPSAPAAKAVIDSIISSHLSSSDVLGKIPSANSAEKEKSLLGMETV